MGKNSGNSWLDAVKKAFRSPVKQNDEKRVSSRRREETDQEEEEKKRGKRRWIFRKSFPFETTIQHNAANTSGENLLKRNEKKMENSVISEPKSTIAMAMATAAAAEAAVAKAQAAVEIIRLSKYSSLLVKENEAALFIQSVFRGYLARRALLALKGVVKLQALIRGHNVRKRAKMTLQCIQSLVRVQAQVCDQRRRLSCESTSLATIFSQANTSRKSISNTPSNYRSNDFGDLQPPTLEEIKALIHKAKQCSIKHGSTLAHALINQRDRPIKTVEMIDPSDHTIKTVEIDTSRQPYLTKSPHYHNFQDNQLQYHEEYLDPYIIPSPIQRKHDNIRFHSPKASSSSKIKSKIQVNSSSPRYHIKERNYSTAETPTLRSNYFHRMSMSENSCPVPRPNYMAATASAMARLRSHSAPRQRPLSPNKEPSSCSAKKRLSFPFPDADHDNVSGRRYKSVHSRQVGFEEMSSCCTE